MSVTSTSLTSGLPSVDYQLLHRADQQSQNADLTSSADLAQLTKPSTASLDASSLSSNATVQQLTRPSDVSLDADTLQQLTTYMTNKTSLEATAETQMANQKLMTAISSAVE